MMLNKSNMVGGGKNQKLISMGDDGKNQKLISMGGGGGIRGT